VKLYDVKQSSGIKVRVVTGEKREYIFVFSHIDANYAYCSDSNGNPVHLSPATEVEVIHE